MTNKDRKTTGVVKAILFASIIVAMILPFGTTNATTEETPNEDIRKLQVLKKN